MIFHETPLVSLKSYEKQKTIACAKARFQERVIQCVFQSNLTEIIYGFAENKDTIAYSARCLLTLDLSHKKTVTL